MVGVFSTLMRVGVAVGVVLGVFKFFWFLRAVGGGSNVVFLWNGSEGFVIVVGKVMREMGGLSVSCDRVKCNSVK